MKLIIDIPEEEYEEILSSEDCGLHTLTRAVVNGTPVPKGHGRLIDADKYRHLWVDIYDSSYGGKCAKMFKESVDNAETVIEADRGGVE